MSLIAWCAVLLAFVVGLYLGFFVAALLWVARSNDE